MNIKELQKKIEKNGRLAGSVSLSTIRSEITGASAVRKKAIPVKRMGEPVVDQTPSELIVVGNAPENYGQSFVWNRADEHAYLAVYLNAADPLGVSIANLKRGDQIHIQYATGLASFSKNTGNPLAQSIISLVATAAEVAATIYGVPEIAPLIEAGESFAKEQFQATGLAEKVRDAFGVDPGSGHKARQEGGFVVNLPEALGPQYSGNGDHESRWIKKPGDRVDKNLPPHLRGAFFPLREQSSSNTRMAMSHGEAYLNAWDWKFEDNAGYYKVFVHLIRGDGVGPIEP